MNQPVDQLYKTPCRHLRSKEMYYQAFGGSDEDPDASGVFWCARTQEAFGPDGEAAVKTDCCGGRGCYIN